MCSYPHTHEHTRTRGRTSAHMSRRVRARFVSGKQLIGLTAKLRFDRVSLGTKKCLYVLYIEKHSEYAYVYTICVCVYKQTHTHAGRARADIHSPKTPSKLIQYFILI